LAAGAGAAGVAAAGAGVAVCAIAGATVSASTAAQQVKSFMRFLSELGAARIAAQARM
jgi:hypothetical protein